MPTVHNYAACSIEICLACDSFSDGWTAGKAKAYAEIPRRSSPSEKHGWRVVGGMMCPVQ